jgi:FlgD Ig-like domain
VGLSRTRASVGEQIRGPAPYNGAMTRLLRLSMAVFCLFALHRAGSSALAEISARIEAVSVSRPFFNPSQGQTVSVSFTATAPGNLTVRIVDRDGFLVRTLVSDQKVTPGGLGYSWDGRDEAGKVVPDEAYSLKIELKAAQSTAEYFPASRPAEDLKASVSYYDRRTSVFSYRLPKPARVHMQAGIVTADSKAGKRSGPVLKTIVNRAPRPEGPVIETWNGLDETGAFYVPDLPGFAIAVAATALPENSIIAVGNSDTTFLERAGSRTGESLLRVDVSNHAHHRGLSALDDVAPKLVAQPSNAQESKDRRWKSTEPLLRGRLVLEGLSAEHFARQPGALVIFVDGRPVRTVAKPATGMPFEVSLRELSAGDHIIAFDWASEYGPVAVTSLLVTVPEKTARVASKGRGEK